MHCKVTAKMDSKNSNEKENSDSNQQKQSGSSVPHQLSDKEAVATKKQRKEAPKLLIAAVNKSSKWWPHFKVYNPVADGYKKGIAVC